MSAPGRQMRRLRIVLDRPPPAPSIAPRLRELRARMEESARQRNRDRALGRRRP
ncbi:MAG TPA: hypothetical protein VNE82_12735 [Candidatus Binataceae bacterium]|nr:hypothetical protein [Candidatus Binataceae bacterium]HVB80797.1 hypothetical protein [Candidatus Binataceae bacterium]